MSKQQTIEGEIQELFSAERQARRMHDQLAGRAAHARDELLVQIGVALREAKQLEDVEEAALRMVCVARLLGELDGPEVVDALIDLLDTDLPEARNEAGEQLQGLAFDRFKEVALGIERALVRLASGSPALVELPYLLVEIPEAGVLELLGKLLEHEDADAVASAIEALAEVGDPSAVKLLLPLQGDKRISRIGEGDEETEVAIGELAIEAIELLRQPESE